MTPKTMIVPFIREALGLISVATEAIHGAECCL